MIIYLLKCYLFDDIGKYRNHSCESFCYIKDNFDKNTRATYMVVLNEIQKKFFAKTLKACLLGKGFAHNE